MNRENSLYEMNQELLESIANSVTKAMNLRPVDREDAKQECLIAIFRGLPKFRSESSLKTWAYRVSVNAVHTYLSNTRRSAETVTLDSLHEETRFINVEMGYYNSLLESALDSLPPSEKKVIIMHRIEGMTLSEVQEILGVTTHQVRRRELRGLAKLAAFFKS